MPAYSYVALNRNGSKKKGIVSAESEREARRLVKDLKLTPLKVTESKDLGKTLRIKNKDVVLMTRQLATLLEASTPLVESIEITANQTKNQNLVYVLYGLKEEIIQGRRLGTAMKKFPGVFSDTYISTQINPLYDRKVNVCAMKLFMFCGFPVFVVITFTSLFSILLCECCYC